MWLDGLDSNGLADKHLGGGQLKLAKGPRKKPQARPIQKNLAMEYPYTDERGNKLFRVRRYEEPGPEGRGDKMV